MKRTLVILLTLLVMIPISASKGYDFSYDFEVDGICYKINKTDSLTVKVVARDRLADGGGYTDLGDVVIPSTVSNNGLEYPVTQIEDKAFRLNNSLTSISLPNTITSIGEAAFYRCYSLTHINLPESLTEIKVNAFCFSGIQGDLVIPKNLKKLGRAFVECKGVKTIYYNAVEATYAENATNGPLSEYAEQIIFGDSVKSIPAYLCYGMFKITSVTIPPSVTSIGKNALDSCNNLRSITWNATHYPTSIQIPSSINQLTIGEDVEVIPPSLAYGSAITSIVIPDNVTAIGGSAFHDCVNLTSATLGNSVTSIGGGAFKNCVNLTSVTLGNSLTSLGSAIFENCSQLASISIPSSVTEIPLSLFMGCSSLASFDIPSSVTTISQQAFYGCSSLASITIPASVTSILSNAFYGCTGLMSIEVEAGNTVYDSRDNCNALIESATNTLMTSCRNTVIPNTVVTIGQAAFANHTQITQIEIPNSVTNINNSAFSGCTGLTEITLPESITKIDYYAFANCTGLTKITSLAQRPPTIFEGESSGTFKGVSKQTPVYVPKGFKPVYWVADGWKEFTNIYELDEVPVTNKCDVNGDGKVDVSDVNMVINAMLGKI